MFWKDIFCYIFLYLYLLHLLCFLSVFISFLKCAMSLFYPRCPSVFEAITKTLLYWEEDFKKVFQYVLSVLWTLYYHCVCVHPGIIYVQHVYRTTCTTKTVRLASTLLTGRERSILLKSGMLYALHVKKSLDMTFSKDTIQVVAWDHYMPCFPGQITCATVAPSASQTASSWPGISSTVFQRHVFGAVHRWWLAVNKNIWICDAKCYQSHHLQMIAIIATHPQRIEN